MAVYTVFMLVVSKFSLKKYLNWRLNIVFFFFSLLNLSYLMMASDKAAGHVNVMLIDLSTVAYGGILNELSPTVKSDDTDVAKVIEFAVQYANKNHPDTIPQDENGKTVDPVLSDLKKLKLQATRDGKTQHYVVETTLVNAKQQFQRRKVIYGITYSFCLSWSNEVNPHKHNFVVSLDRNRNMYVFEHTFNLDSLISVTSSCSKQGSSQTAIPIATDELTAGSPSECQQGDDGSAVGQSQCKLSSKNLWKFKRRTAEEQTDESEFQSSGKRTKFGTGTVSIMTQNIWNFNSILHGGGQLSSKDKAYMYTDRLSRLGDLIASTKADIVGFQEVRFDVQGGGHLGPCQVQQLAHHLPKYQLVYQPAVNYVPDSFNRSEEGLAIFSLHPIVSHDFILLSRDMNDEDDKLHQRICLHAEIDIPSLGMIHVFVTHLSLSEAARERSVLEIWMYMSKFSGPAVLLGDLNDHPQSRIIRFLQGKLEINSVKTEGLQDAWLLKNKEPRAGAREYAKNEQRDVGLTFSTLNEHLAERIDYIFVRLPGNMQMSSISLVDDGGRGPMAASDHLGLQASIAGV